MSARPPGAIRADEVARIGSSNESINHPSARFVRCLEADDLEGAVVIGLESYNSSVTRSVVAHLERRDELNNRPNLLRIILHLLKNRQVERALTLIETLYAYSDSKYEALSILAKQVALAGDSRKSVEILERFDVRFIIVPEQTNLEFLTNLLELVKRARIREETKKSIFYELVHKVDILGARIIAASFSSAQARTTAQEELDDLVGGNE